MLSSEIDITINLHKKSSDQTWGKSSLAIKLVTIMTIWQQVCIWQEAVRIKLTVKKHFKNPQLRHSQFSCEIMCACPQLPFYRCFYSIFIGWCPHSPQVTCTHMRDRRYIPHDKDVTAVIPIHLCQDKQGIWLCIGTSLTNTHISVSRYTVYIAVYRSSLTITQTEG